MTVETDPDIRRREAAAWFARLKQRRVESEDVEAFSAWRRSPGNAEAFARIEAMWDAAEVLAHDKDIAQLTLAAAGRGARKQPSALSRSWRPAVAALAGVAALGAAGLWFISRPQVYATDVGERRVVQLADGSTVTLDTGSRISVRLRGEARRIELSAGQALFDVSRDPSRPFVVTAGETRVTALGTRFEVRRLGGDIRVVLVEGRVRVDASEGEAPRSWTLQPGEQLKPNEPKPVVLPVDAARVTSWTTGRLLFDGAPLAAAIEEVNRYSKTQVELRAPAVAGIQVSGAFDAGDTEGFVSALTELYPLRIVSTEGDRIVLGEVPEK